jgi:hypothetical protein
VDPVRDDAIQRLVEIIKTTHPTAEIISKQVAVERWATSREHLWQALQYDNVVFYELRIPGLLAGLQKGVILKRVILRVGADYRTDDGERHELLFTRQSATSRD